MSPKSNRKIKRTFNKEMYEARHPIENSYFKLKQLRAIVTRYDEILQKLPRRDPLSLHRHLVQLMTDSSL